MSLETMSTISGLGSKKELAKTLKQKRSIKGVMNLDESVFWKSGTVRRRNL